MFWKMNPWWKIVPALSNMLVCINVFLHVLNIVLSLPSPSNKANDISILPPLLSGENTQITESIWCVFPCLRVCLQCMFNWINRPFINYSARENLFSLLSPHCNSDSITLVLEAQSTVHCMLLNTIHLHYPPGAEKNSMRMGVHLCSGVCTQMHMGKLISLVLDHLLSVLSAGVLYPCVCMCVCIYVFQLVIRFVARGNGNGCFQKWFLASLWLTNWSSCDKKKWLYKGNLDDSLFKIILIYLIMGLVHFLSKTWYFSFLPPSHLYLLWLAIPVTQNIAKHIH